MLLANRSNDFFLFQQMRRRSSQEPSLNFRSSTEARQRARQRVRQRARQD